MVKIYTGQSPIEELSNKLTEEITAILKDAALKMGCNIEELKYRVDNTGMVEISKMSLEEMILSEKKVAKDRKVKDILKARNG